MELGWEILPHLPYSPDLAPSDFHLFRPLKTFLGDQHFGSNDAVKDAVLFWFRHIDKSFYANGI